MPPDAKSGFPIATAGAVDASIVPVPAGSEAGMTGTDIGSAAVGLGEDDEGNAVVAVGGAGPAKADWGASGGVTELAAVFGRGEGAPLSGRDG